ncbi:alpha/beta hydrolase [Arthrobacter crystallopoietes]|uniref:alpha/beta hydrolase n=1 Tax=Crystallibacter crystallopoietes TaxID=37928 RepID=UPI00196AD32B|nr:alpha/beta fold hydrolase [Arthrobacter crystallopoietes]
MARLVVSSEAVRVELSRGEKIAGLLPDLKMSATAVEDVQVLNDGFTGVTGMRAPGLAFPGRVRIGTWRGSRGNTFAVVHQGKPAVQLTLKDQKYRRVVVEVENAEEAARQVREAAGWDESTAPVLEDATFLSDGLTLAGTWTLPAAGPVKGLALLLPGSGEVDRNSDHRRMPLGVTRDLAEALAFEGIAAFGYDKRGVGASEGSFLAAGLQHNYDDAAAAFDLVAQRSPQLPVFVVGHSEGAFHATALAARKREQVAGVVLLSASAHSGEETSQWQTGQIAGALPAFPRIVLKLLRTDLAKQQRKSMVKLHASDQDVLRMQGRRMNARWMREFLRFDPLPLLKQLDMPVLAISGGKDLQVNPADLEIIAREVPGPVETRCIPDLTHLLRRDPRTPMLTDYKRQIRERTDTEVLDAVAGWARSQILATRPPVS